MAYRFLLPTALALILLAVYFSGFMVAFALNSIALLVFILPGALSMALLPDDWKGYGLFLFLVGIVLVVV